MVISMKSIYKKVILTSFSVEPVLRLQCFLVFGRRSAYKNPHPYPVQRILPHGYWLEYANSKVYSVFVVAYWQFLLQSRLSDSIEQYNEPPRLQRNFAKSHFVVTNLPDGCPVRRFSERHGRNDWRETLFDSQDIISELR